MQKLLRTTLIGRPNVGKSSVYNRLLNASRRKYGEGRGSANRNSNAIIADYEGVTRDLIYGEMLLSQGKIIIVDSPGQMLDKDPLHQLMEEKAKQSYENADLLLFVCDGQAGLTALDQEIITQLRLDKKEDQECLVLVNKMDSKESALSDFYSCGYDVIGISAKTGSGIKDLLNLLEEHLDKKEVRLSDTADTHDTDIAPKTLTLLGCPNAGKSTIANLLLKSDKQLVHHLPGSTRDSVHLPINLEGEDWTLIDTAGIRRKGKIGDALEQETVYSAIHSINVASIVAYIIDAEQGIRRQDLNLLHLAAKSRKGIVIAVNKADILDQQEIKDLKGMLEWELAFISYAPTHFISAKLGKGLKPMFKSIKQVCKSMVVECKGGELNRYLQEFTMRHPPPLRQGRRSNLRYVVQAGNNPPQLIIHGKRTEHLPDTYKKYLQNSFSEKLHLIGAPLGIVYKNDANPYNKFQSRSK